MHLGPERMEIWNRAFDEAVEEAVPDQMRMSGWMLFTKIEFEPEYSASFENPDIEEKPPMSLEEVLQKVKPFDVTYEGIKDEDEWQQRRRRRRRCAAGALPPLLHCNLGSEGVPWRTGSRQTSAPRSLHPAPPLSSSSSIWFTSPSASEASTTRAVAPRPPAQEPSAPQLHRVASAGKEVDPWPRSLEHHHRRGSPPPPKRRPSCAILSTTPPTCHPHEPRLCTDEFRGSTTLPPPRRPAEGGETSVLPPASWIEWEGGKIASPYCSGGESRVQDSDN